MPHSRTHKYFPECGLGNLRERMQQILYVFSALIITWTFRYFHHSPYGLLRLIKRHIV